MDRLVDAGATLDEGVVDRVERADDAHLQPLVHLTAPFDHDEGNDMVGVVNGEDNSPASDTRLSQIAHSGERAGDAGMVGGLSQFINAKANSPLQLSVQAIESD